MPMRRIAPESACVAPVMTLMSVDLPAPFWPMRAWISPARMSKLTSSSAATPGYRLHRPQAWKTSRSTGSPDGTGTTPVEGGLVLTGLDGRGGVALVKESVVLLDELGDFLAGQNL